MQIINIANSNRSVPKPQKTTSKTILSHVLTGRKQPAYNAAQIFQWFLGGYFVSEHGPCLNVLMNCIKMKLI